MFNIKSKPDKSNVIYYLITFLNIYINQFGH